MANLVAIVGRPNVGKSTLFNRLTKTRSAIVSDTAGTTRDRQYGKCDWNGREFSVVDTGGWVVNSDDIFEDAIRKQVLVATEEADLVLFLVDIMTGIKMLRRYFAVRNSRLYWLLTRQTIAGSITKLLNFILSDLEIRSVSVLPREAVRAICSIW